MAINKIAILGSTKPIRKLKSKGGRVYEAIDPKALARLTDHFDLVIIGSTASDELYRRVYAHLTAHGREKFRMYSKSFFKDFAGGAGILSKKKDEKDEGWKEILKTNKIRYELTRRVFGEDFRYHYVDFSYEDLQHFVTDERVSFIESEDDIPGAKEIPEIIMPPEDMGEG